MTADSFLANTTSIASIRSLLKTFQTAGPRCNQHNDLNQQFPLPTYSDKDLAAQCQRLMHLRHAARCSCNPTQEVCKISPFCGNLKRLWSHMLTCKEEFCNVRLCTSSRFILNHYNQCEDRTCRICEPVRISSKRSHVTEDEKALLEQFQIKAPPPKRVRQSTSRASLIVIASHGSDGASSDGGSDCERDSSCSDSSGSCEEFKNDVTRYCTSTKPFSSLEKKFDQKSPEMVKLMHCLAQVIISTPQND